MKKITILSVLVLATAAVFADAIVVDSIVTITGDTTIVEQTPVDTGWKSVFTFQNVLIIFAGMYEIAARVYPTTKNWSALSLIYQIINLIVPNVKKDGTKHK